MSTAVLFYCPINDQKSSADSVDLCPLAYISYPQSPTVGRSDLRPAWPQVFTYSIVVAISAVSSIVLLEARGWVIGMEAGMDAGSSKLEDG